MTSAKTDQLSDNNLDIEAMVLNVKTMVKQCLNWCLWASPCIESSLGMFE